MLRISTLLCAAALALSACGDDAGSDGGTSGGGIENCPNEWVEKTNASAPDLMTSWGLACSTDADCSMLGEGATCYTDVLGVFALPGGYCSKPCALPDSGTTFLTDAMDCNPDGGVTCVGAKDIFTACAVPCSEDSECSREGYGCVRMPVISAPSDPKFCLMNEAECCLDPDMCNTPP